MRTAEGRTTKRKGGGWCCRVSLILSEPFNRVEGIAGARQGGNPDERGKQVWRVECAWWRVVLAAAQITGRRRRRTTLCPGLSRIVQSLCQLPSDSEGPRSSGTLKKRGPCGRSPYSVALYNAAAPAKVCRAARTEPRDVCVRIPGHTRPISLSPVSRGNQQGELFSLLFSLLQAQLPLLIYPSPRLAYTVSSALCLTTTARLSGLPSCTARIQAHLPPVTSQVRRHDASAESDGWSAGHRPRSKQPPLQPLLRRGPCCPQEQATSHAINSSNQIIGYLGGLYYPRRGACFQPLLAGQGLANSTYCIRLMTTVGRRQAVLCQKPTTSWRTALTNRDGQPWQIARQTPSHGSTLQRNHVQPTSSMPLFAYNPPGIKHDSCVFRVQCRLDQSPARPSFSQVNLPVCCCGPPERRRGTLPFCRLLVTYGPFGAPMLGSSPHFLLSTLALLNSCRPRGSVVSVRREMD